MKLNELDLRAVVGHNVKFKAVLTVEDMLLTQAGKPYLEITVVSGIAREKIKCWDIANPTHLTGKVVIVIANCYLYMNKPTLKGLSITLVDEDPIQFISGDPDMNLTQLRIDLIASDFILENGPYALITRHILEEVRESFFYAPAAKTFHHAYVGGLAEHSLEVVSQALLWNSSDLVRAAALLHDVGKVAELRIDPATYEISYTAAGSLLTHPIIGCSMVDHAAFSLWGNYSSGCAEEIMLLKHCILSHHGTVQMGAVVTPACEESEVVAHADAISASRFKSRINTKKAMPGEVATVFEMGSLVSYYRAKGDSTNDLEN